MKTVYVVTSGVYSDYGINAIFSSKQKAQAYIDTVDNKAEGWQQLVEPRIEEWLMDLPKKQWLSTRVRMDKEGNVIAAEIVNSGENEEIGFITWDYNGNLLWGVATTDKRKAIKVTNEKRVWILANNLWGKELTDEAKEASKE